MPVNISQLPSAVRSMPQVGTDPADVDELEVDRLGDGDDAGRGQRGRPGAEQLRRDVADDLVDQARRAGTRRPGSGRPRAAPARHAAVVQARRRARRRSTRPSGPAPTSAAVAIQVRAAPSRTRASAGVRPAESTTTRSGCRLASAPASVADGQVRVVGEHGADPDDDGVHSGAQLLHVGPGVRRGDPLAGAVERGRPTVQRGGELPDHERARVAGGGPAVAVSQARLPACASAARSPDLDVDARAPAASRRRRRRPGSGRRRRPPPGRRRPRISASVHGPVRPVWLQGSRVTTAVPPRARSPAAASAPDLGVRPAGVRVEALADDLAGRRRGSRSRRPGWGWCVPRPRAASAMARSIAASSAGLAIRPPRAARSRRHIAPSARGRGSTADEHADGAGTADGAAIARTSPATTARCLPSGL